MTDRLAASESTEPESAYPGPRRHAGRQWAVSACLVVLAALVFLATAWPMQAAVLLEEFNVFVTPNDLVLQWVTLEENNLDGFEIFCKEEAEPESAYHPIGTVIAEGSLTEGAAYTFDVTGLEQGVSYCFRIEEITSDDAQGSQFDRCGYGLGITPTPAPATLQPAGVIQVSPLETPGADQNPIPAGGAPQVTAAPPQQIGGATLTPTPTFTQLPAATPTPTFTFTPVSGSPLQSPTPTQVGDSPLDSPVDAAAVQATAQAAATQTEAPVSPLQGATPTAPATALPGEESAPNGGEDANSLTQGAPGDLSDEAVDAASQALPTPLYIVVTVTPTPESDGALAVAPPTFTPLPTITPAADAGLLALNELTTENLLLATLCIVFFGASGIGVLGITSLGLYFRSRPDRR